MAVIPPIKKIRLKLQNPSLGQAIKESLNIHPVASRVLAARGFKPDETLKNFITPSLKDGIPSPDGIKNLQQAADLLIFDLKSSNKVAICSDFDVDGLSSAALVSSFFKHINLDHIALVPDRFTEGYGLNKNMIQQAKDAGCSTVLTIDYGTKNSDELAFAQQMGLKTIVVDHHHVGDSAPSCDAFVNPAQPGCGFAGGTLCAAGLSWYLIVAMKQRLGVSAQVDPKLYLDFAALGTICDMVPLTGVNRVIAKRGLELLTKTQRVGLVALKNIAGINGPVNCSDVSFGLGPRINAAGRMVHGSLVLELLTTTENSKAQQIAKRLNTLNAERQEMESKIKEAALAQIQSLPALPPALVVWNKDFHTGVLGIVAQRLVETYYRPSAVMGSDGEGVLKGSVRGVKGISVVDLLERSSHTLIKYGGHVGAGGFAVLESRAEEFKAAFTAASLEATAGQELFPSVEADTEAHIQELDLSLIRDLQKFAPFGMGNSSPILLAKGLSVAEVRELKGPHLKAILTDGTHFINAVLWRTKTHPALFKGSKINAALKLELNNYRGVSEIVANLQAVEAA